MTNTRNSVKASIGATRSALGRLTPAQFEAARAKVAAEIQAFVRDEWLQKPARPDPLDRYEAYRRRAGL